MQNLFRSIDTAVINFVERCCHRTQRAFGFTNFSWWKILVTIFFAIMLLDTLKYFFGFPNTALEKTLKHSPLWQHILSLSVFGIFAVWGCNWWERKSLARLTKGLANPLKPYFISFWCRWMFYLQGMSAVIIFFVDALSGLIMLAVTVYMVLIIVLPACDPLPPTKSKFRAWLESFILRPVRN